MSRDKREIKALLFSDVKGFSQLDEKSCLAFSRSFFSGVDADILNKYAGFIDLKNTWGDALHLVFNDPVKAGCVALELQEWVKQYPWPGIRPEARPQMRIGLHVGVVTPVDDPILGKRNYVGRNTSKAARIEPITEEGQIYVSGAFAAFAALAEDCPFVCEYVGTRELAKHAGPMAVYMLQRK